MGLPPTAAAEEPPPEELTRLGAQVVEVMAGYVDGENAWRFGENALDHHAMPHCSADRNDEPVPEHERGHAEIKGAPHNTRTLIRTEVETRRELVTERQR